MTHPSHITELDTRDRPAPPRDPFLEGVDHYADLFRHIRAVLPPDEAEAVEAVMCGPFYDGPYPYKLLAEAVEAVIDFDGPHKVSGPATQPIRPRRQHKPRKPLPEGLKTAGRAAAKLGCSIKQPQKHKAETPKRVPSPDTITTTTPLRLDIAAQIAFPDGSIGVSGLRREIERGNLRVEQIAGKTFTTLANIEDMRKKCAIPTKGRESSSENHGGRENPTDGSSSTAMPAAVASSARQAHLRQVAQGLRNSGRTPKKPSPTTSDESTSRNSAAVIRLKSE